MHQDMTSRLIESDPAKLRSVKAFIIDMDGVLYVGQEPLPGAQAFLNHLEEQHTPFVLATNNSTLTPAQYVSKLESMGIAVKEEHILTSAQATAMYVSGMAAPTTRVYVIGEIGLVTAVKEQGLSIGADGVDFVVVGLDFDLTYEKLRTATMAIRAGAAFVGTNPDTTLPSEDGLIPGNGAILAALEAATGVAPLIVGKPEPILLRLAIEKLGVAAECTAIVGDRLETDILGGRRVGLVTILVLTGISNQDELRTSSLKPNLVFPNIGSLHEAWIQQQDR